LPRLSSSVPQGSNSLQYEKDAVQGSSAAVWQKLFRLRGRSEERAKGYRTQNTVTVLQRGAKPAQEKNEINGDPELVEGKEPVYVGFDLEQA
jgi:hypothetical protein